MDVIVAAEIEALLARVAGLNEPATGGTAGQAMGPMGPMGLADRLRLLRAVPLFGAMAADQLLDLAAAAVPRAYEPGQTIVRRGSAAAAGLYLVAEGNVAVLAEGDRDGALVETTVAQLGAGELIGELSLVDGRPRPATCVAMTRTRCLHLGGAAIARTLDRSPELGRALLGVAVERPRAAGGRGAEQQRDPVAGLGMAALAAERCGQRRAV
jgi:CRP-like cAMP-binding protein